MLSCLREAPISRDDFIGDCHTEIRFYGDLYIFTDSCMYEVGDVKPIFENLAALKELWKLTLGDL